MTKDWLHRYCVLLAVCTLLLLIAGALVTSNDAGQSYQRVHRAAGAIVGLLTIGLAAGVWRSRLRWLGIAALSLVVIQGALGALTVLYGLPKATGVVHACLAQLSFSMAVVLALLTSRDWGSGGPALEDSGRPSLRSLAAALPACALAQAALGAAYRHNALGLMPHVVGALVLTGMVLAVSMIVLTQFGDYPSLARPAKRLLVITLHQVVLGVLAYFARIITLTADWQGPLVTGLTVAHVAVGALTMAASVVLAMQAHRAVASCEPILN